jgi:hypothetical protein
MSAVIDEVYAMEVRLREAMLSGDVELLDSILVDDLIFTNQDGQRLSKADDLAAHRSGRLKITKLDISNQHVRPSGTCAIVAIAANVAGSFDGHRFVGLFSYTRVWQNVGGNWKVVAAHCSAIT